MLSVSICQGKSIWMEWVTHSTGNICLETFLVSIKILRELPASYETISVPQWVNLDGSPPD